MKSLIVAEKPSVAREIAQVLGAPKNGDWHENDQVVITSGIGHLVEIFVEETPGAALPVIPAQFSLRPIEKTKSQYSLIKKLAARSDISEIVNACDAGREGELIFRLIYEAIGSKKTMRRMWIQSMTAESLREAYRGMRPGSEFDALGKAARSRAEADWLVGINGSRAFSRQQNKPTSVGRVQTPTLALVVQRHLEIVNFRPKDYFELHGTFQVQAGQFVAKLQNKTPADGEPSERFNDQSLVKSIMSQLSGKNPSSITDESKPVSKASPKLYDLTTLQRDANKKFGFSAKETLDLAQSLYETKKVLTYPRTDSSALPEDYVAEAGKVMQSLNLEPYAELAAQVVSQGWIKPTKKIFDNSKISDHFAIIPTGKRPEGLSPAEQKIFDLVVQRFIAAFYPAAEYQATTRTVAVDTEAGQERFKATGRVLLKAGWLEVYGQAIDEDDEDKEPALCKVEQGESGKTAGLDLKSLKTKPPKPFTEATLLAAMETAGKFVEDDELAQAMKEKGIGTPATRASIIETLVSERDGKGAPKEPYIRREKKALVPTPKALDLIAFLQANKIESLTSPSMTGEWEHKLRLVEAGQLERSTFMSEVAQLTKTIVGSTGSAGQLAPTQLKQACPVCGKATLMSTQRTIDCACGFKLWRSISGKVLSEQQIEQLLTTGKVDTITGFVSSKTNKSFNAGLKLVEGGKLEFVFDNSAPMGTTASCKCPKCSSSMSMSPKVLQCTNGSCGLKVWRTIAGKTLTEGQVTQLVTKGSVGPVSGFISKAGKAFAAKLNLEGDGRVGFQFEK